MLYLCSLSWYTSPSTGKGSWAVWKMRNVVPSATVSAQVPDICTNFRTERLVYVSPRKGCMLGKLYGALKHVYGGFLSDLRMWPQGFRIFEA